LIGPLAERDNAEHSFDYCKPARDPAPAADPWRSAALLEGLCLTLVLGPSGALNAAKDSATNKIPNMLDAATWFMTNCPCVKGWMWLARIIEHAVPGGRVSASEAPEPFPDERLCETRIDIAVTNYPREESPVMIFAPG
jgi:hypothetical protein